MGAARQPHQRSALLSLGHRPRGRVGDRVERGREAGCEREDRMGPARIVPRGLAAAHVDDASDERGSGTGPGVEQVDTGVPAPVVDGIRRAGSRVPAPASSAIKACNSNREGRQHRRLDPPGAATGAPAPRGGRPVLPAPTWTAASAWRHRSAPWRPAACAVLRIAAGGASPREAPAPGRPARTGRVPQRDPAHTTERARAAPSPVPPKPQSRCCRPLARWARRSTAARTDASVPTTRTLRCARVTAV